MAIRVYREQSGRGRNGVMWRARVTVNVDGTRRRQGLSAETRGEVMRLARDAERRLGLPGSAADARMTVSDLLDRFSDDYMADTEQIRNSTRQRYASIIEHHLRPGLGRIKLRNLRQRQIAELWVHDRKAGLSARSVLQHYAVLHKALEYARKLEMIATNPADDARPPTPRRYEAPVVGVEDLQRIVAAARGSQLYLPVMLAGMLGLRRGEALGLRWRDLNLDAGTATISSSLEVTRAAGFLLKPPKTERARTLPMPAFLTAALRSHRAAQDKERLAYGPAYANKDFVCAQADGEPINPETITSAFRRLVGQLGVDVTFHGLRHSYATLLLESGVGLRDLQDALGHTLASTTLNVYSHVTERMRDRRRDLLDGLFSAESFGQRFGNGSAKVVPTDADTEQGKSAV